MSVDAVKKRAIERFVAERNDAVWSFSVPKFRNFIKKYFPHRLQELEYYSRIQLKGMMAKMCFNIEDTPEEVLIDAGKILVKLGWTA